MNFSIALKRILWAFPLATLALLITLALNTYRQGSRQIAVKPALPVTIDVPAASSRLAGALRFRTISRDGQPQADNDEFVGLHSYLRQQYPLVHKALKSEQVGGHSLLYTWAGTDPNARPIMLMAHQDVVPVAPGTEGDWLAEPFAGAIRDGFIWGRGAWDDKGNLLAMMEAVELLLAQGIQPRQTIYFAFGHDEENGGENGAKAISGLLQSRGVRLQFVLDEGFFITEGVMPGLQQPLALIGTAEKGILTVALSVQTAPGHSSAPPADGAISLLSRGLTRLQDSPLQARITGATAEMFDAIAPESSGAARLVLSNRWLFAPLLTAQLKKTPATGAMLRTTTALTVIQAGNKENVLPGRAEALVNFRLLPGDSAQQVLKHVKAAVDTDAIKVSVRGSAQEASFISSSRSRGYGLIETTLRQTYPGTLVAPALLIGGTDARHMAHIADDIYRFSPMRARREDLARFHGSNERIAIDDYAQMIRFYARLLKNSSEQTRAAVR
jgi:carboxypeptidase PM20D1